MNNQNISFSDRIISLPSGFSLIWPFRNVAKSFGPYELFLDNNALVSSRWFTELEKSIKYKSTISPIHALSEQWLSNPAFGATQLNELKNSLCHLLIMAYILESIMPLHLQNC